MAHSNVTSTTHDHFTESGEHIISKDVSVSHIGIWLKKGWMDMAHAPMASFFYGAVMALSVMLVYAAFSNQPVVMFQIATFFVILSPFLAIGLYAISCQLSRNMKPDLFRSLFAWKRNPTDFALFALVLGVIVAIWARIVPLIVSFVGSNGLLIVDPDAGVMSFVGSDLGMTFMSYFLVSASVVAAFVFAISVVTIPLLLRDNKAGLISSMVLSFQVVMENKAVMSIWALIIGALVTLGIVTLGVAMLVVMPLLGYASWHAFNDLIEVDDKKSAADLDL